MDITFTYSQKKAYSKLMEFVEDENAKIFILKGYAVVMNHFLFLLQLDELQKY